METGKNKRKFERHHSNLFIDLFSRSLLSKIGRGVMVDISLAGLAIETEADLKIGEEYECRIEFPISIRAKVVRVVQEGQIKQYGLRTIGQTLIDRFILRRLLKGRKITGRV